MADDDAGVWDEFVDVVCDGVDVVDTVVYEEDLAFPSEFSLDGLLMRMGL